MKEFLLAPYRFASFMLREKRRLGAGFLLCFTLLTGMVVPRSAVFAQGVLLPGGGTVSPGGIQAAPPAQSPDQGGCKSSAAAVAVAEIVSDVIGAIRYVLSGVFFLAAELVLWVMNYNNYIFSAPVSAGWSVVRDFTNMLFILVLLVIAFGIMFGDDRYGTVAMLPTLFIVAILINFSRTLIGFMIDIAQVFMLTFANAFTSAGSSTFASLFNVGGAVNLNNKAVEAVNCSASAIIIGSLASTALLIMVTVVMGYLALLLVYRIVALWILIVVSPLAWLMRIVPTAHGYYAEWWKEFKCWLLVGPVTAFFIWLTLATAAGGSNGVLQDQGVKSKVNGVFPEQNNVGTTENAGWAAIVKAIIAVAMLLKGIEIAAGLGCGASVLQSARKRTGAAPGFVGGLIGGAAGGVAGAGIRRAARALPAGGFAEKVAKAPSLPGLAVTTAGKYIQKAAPVAATVGLGGYVSAAAARTAAAGGKLTKTEEDRIKAQVPDVTAGGNKDVAIAAYGQLQKRMEAAGSFDSLSQADQVQFKALKEGFEKSPEVFEKMKPAEVASFFAGSTLHNQSIKDPQKRREAVHHTEELLAKNVNRMPQATQASVLRNLPPEFQEKVVPEAVTINAAEFAKGGTAAAAEETRVRDNIEALAGDRVTGLGGNPEALARVAKKSPGAMGSIMENASPAQINAMMQTRMIKNDDVGTSVLAAAPAANVAAFVGGSTHADRAESRSNRARQQMLAGTAAAPGPLRAHNATAGASPTLANQSIQNIQANIELLLAEKADADEARRPIDPAVVSSTLGYDGSTFIGDARNNMVRVLGNSTASADVFLAMNPADIASGEMNDVIGKSAQRGSLGEIAKRIQEGKLTKTPQITAMYTEVLGSLRRAGRASVADSLEKDPIIHSTLS